MATTFRETRLNRWTEYSVAPARYRMGRCGDSLTSSVNTSGRA